MNFMIKKYYFQSILLSLLCFNHAGQSSHQINTYAFREIDQNLSSFKKTESLENFFSKEEQNSLKRFFLGAMLESNEAHRKNHASLRISQQTTDFFNLLNTSFSNHKKQIKIQNYDLLQIYQDYLQFLMQIAQYSDNQLSLFFDGIKKPVNSPLLIDNEYNIEIRIKNALKMIWSTENSINQTELVYPTFVKINKYIFDMFDEHHLLDHNQNFYSELNPKKAFLTLSIDQDLFEQPPYILFYKDLNSSVLPLLSLQVSKMQRQMVCYGYNSFLGEGSYLFLIEKNNIVENSGFIIESTQQGLQVYGYCGLNNPQAFKYLSTKMIIPTENPVYQWISQIKDFNEDLIFIPLLEHEQDDRIVEKYLLEEIKNIIIEDLNYTNDTHEAQENLSKVKLLIEKVAPELAHTWQQSVEIINEKCKREETINSADIPLIEVLENKINVYNQMIINEQQQRTRMVVENIHYELEKSQNKKQKHKKAHKKLKTDAVPIAQSSKLKIDFDQEIKGAIKFRKLVKLIGQMIKDLPVEQIQSIITGSHLNFHGNQTDKQTLVLKSGGTSIAPSTARKIVNGFMSFFQKSITLVSQTEKTNDNA